MKKLIAILYIGIILIFIAQDIVAASAEEINIPQSWFLEEQSEKYKILNAFWQKRILLYNKNSIDNFKKTIIANHFPNDQMWKEK